MSLLTSIFVSAARFRIQRLTALVVFCVTLSSVNAQPSDVKVPGIDVESSYNFGSVLRQDGPSQIAVLASNYSAGPIEGQLYLCDANDRRQLLSDVYLTQQQIQRFAWIRDLDGWQSPYIEMLDASDSDKVLWRKTLPVMSISSGSVMVLLVSNTSQKFQLPAAEMSEEQPAADVITYNYTQGYDEPIAYSDDGYFIETANAKPWEIPDHFGGLVEFPAIVFAENTDVSNLNVAQWRALAEWVAMGGQLYFHSEIPDFRQQLEAESPFQLGPAQTDGAFDIYECGVGRVLEFGDPLVKPGTTDQSQSIGRQITSRTAQDTLEHPCQMISTTEMRRGYVVEPNRARMIGGMVIYGLLSGLVTMMMFRRTQRQVAIYLFSIVAIASVSAVVLGFNIRQSKGIVQLTTVTQAGADGAAQYGVARLYSSGGLNQQLKLTGRHPEIRLCKRTQRRWYYQESSTPYLPAFNLGEPRSRSPETQEAVPISPWGTRDLFATDFPEENLRIKCQLKMSKAGPGGYQIDFRGTSPQGLEFKRATLLIANAEVGNSLGQQGSTAATATLNLPKFVPGEEVAFSTTTRLNRVSTSQLESGFSNNQNIALGKVPARGMHVWIIGQLGASPGMKIDDTIGYDIDKQHHLFVQKLTDAEMELIRTPSP